MAHNAYLLSPVARGGTTAFWPAGGTIYKEDFAWFAVCCYQSINGDLGGTWSPSSAIIIGGSGVQLVGPFATGASTTIGTTNTDTLTINAFSTFVNGWQANSTSAFHGNITFDAGTYGSATAVSDSHVNWTINGILTVALAAQLNGGAAFGGDVSIAGGASAFSVGSGVTTTINGPLVQNKKRTIGTGAAFDAIRNHAVNDANYSLLTTAMFETLDFCATSAIRTLTLPDSGLVIGHRVYVTNFLAAHKVHVTDTLSTEYGYIPVNGWIVFEANPAGGWSVIAAGTYTMDTTPA